MSARVVVLREVESRMQFLVAGDASSFRIAVKNATLLKNNLQELMNDTSFDVQSTTNKWVVCLTEEGACLSRRVFASRRRVFASWRRVLER